MRTVFFLIFLIPGVLFSGLLYNSFVSPIPEQWSEESNINFNGVVFKVTPWISIGNWETNFVTKYVWGWGTPTNPGEKVFYISTEIPPLIDIIFNYNSNGFSLFLDISVQREYFTRVKEYSTNLLSAELFDLSKYSFDMNFPELAYIYYANDNFFVSVGRFPIKWGVAHYPVTISDTTYQDNITFSIKFEDMRYTFHFISSYPLLSNEELYIQKNYYDGHTPERYFFEPCKSIIAHRFDFKLGNFRWGIGELNVVGGKYPDLIDFNPITIFHNTYGEGFSNVVASLDFDYEVSDSVFLYGEFSLDDYQVPFTEGGSDYKPTAYAYNFGFKYSLKNFSFWGEYTFSSEWMYITNYLPYLRINVRHFYMDNKTSPQRALVDYPLGFKYGPDATMVSLGFQTDIFDTKISFEYNFLLKGTVVDGDVERWKWFWDSWPGNVDKKEDIPEPEIPYKGKDILYNIVTFSVKYHSVVLYTKVVNERYLIGISFGF
ncbi:hypothetical protein JYK00_04880 [Thermosipho ferrireducens]|uniref:Uncharacterized protein n=1 Tax=Thermosipho ferrireducens TaxID=2571116 RepID=A0ABX7SA33_9BACT|nr:hypothetical protein [Thermosipho ferrireducens]QTA38843.1 hypothetical protein JYK00_04880 [Thermosipho ferrireducens]